MTDLRMRPRFQLDVACEAETLVRVLRDRIEDSDPGLEGFFDPRHCVLRIPPARRAFWSPELDLTFERREDGGPGVRVRCLFGPRPGVWTGFAFVYAALAALAFVGALCGVAQVTLGEPLWGFAATGIALAAIGAVYAGSFIGQGLAAAQMYQLRRYLDVCIAAAEQRAFAEPRTALDSAQL
jgi:hypothetical protein